MLVFLFILINANPNHLINEVKNNDLNLKSFKIALQTSEVGEDVNVTLHQSYLSTATIELVNFTESNTVILPCPTEVTFNSSYTEFLIEDIYAPNKTLIIEDEEIQVNKHELLIFPRYASFQVKGSCYLENVSVLISEDSTGDQDFFLDVYNATLSDGYVKYNTSIAPTSKTLYNINHSTMGWEDITNWHFQLNIENTYNNTFFIKVWCQSSQQGYWHYGSNGVYDSVIWRDFGSFPELTSNDLGLKLDFIILDNTPTPSEINLRINNTIVNDNDDENQGSWVSTKKYTNPSGNIEFELSADWWDVACNITRAQVNYTKTDLKANTNYEIPEPDLVIWNASINEIIDSFDARINVYNYIQFTISSNWSAIKAFNGSIEILDIFSGPAINSYRDVSIFGAGNGADWYLTAVIDNRIPGNGGEAIPFGNYFLLFTTVAILSLIYFMKRKKV